MSVVQVATAAAPSDDQKPALTRQYLGMLRSGDRQQPSLRAASAIAVAFAELSRRSGEPCTAGAILSYLAGEHPSLGASPENVRAGLLDDSGASNATSEVTMLARDGGDRHSVESLDDIATLIDQLSRPAAAPIRQRLARILGIRSDDDHEGR